MKEAAVKACKPHAAVPLFGIFQLIIHEQNPEGNP